MKRPAPNMLRILRRLVAGWTLRESSVWASLVLERSPTAGPGETGSEFVLWRTVLPMTKRGFISQPESPSGIWRITELGRKLVKETK